MHTIEPFYNWELFYNAASDPYSPFFEKEYSEFEYSETIYDHYIHPQWDNIGSSTLFVKLLFVDYEAGYAVIELMGEWNDLLYNDIMFLKRNIIEHLLNNGISKYILILENVLNFHYSDDCYYEEWFEDIDEGWIVLINTRKHVLSELKEGNIDQYFLTDGILNDFPWRTFLPTVFCEKINEIALRRLS